MSELRFLVVVIDYRLYLNALLKNSGDLLVYQFIVIITIIKRRNTITDGLKVVATQSCYSAGCYLLYCSTLFCPCARL